MFVDDLVYLYIILVMDEKMMKYKWIYDEICTHLMHIWKNVYLRSIVLFYFKHGI